MSCRGFSRARRCFGRLSEDFRDDFFQRRIFDAHVFDRVLGQNRRQRLADLDEGRAQRFQVADEFLGATVFDDQVDGRVGGRDDLPAVEAAAHLGGVGAGSSGAAGAAGGAEAAFYLIYSPFLPEQVIGLATAGWRFFTFYFQLGLASLVFALLALSPRAAQEAGAND